MQWWLNSTRSSCLKNTCSVISPASVNTAHSTILGDKYVLERATRHHRCTVSRVGYISRCEGSNLSVSATNLCYPPEEMINKILQLILQKVGLATDVMYRTKISFLGVLLSVLLQHLYVLVLPFQGAVCSLHKCLLNFGCVSSKEECQSSTNRMLHLCILYTRVHSTLVVLAR